jgi:phosphoribosylanthranilate isomerase
MDLKIKICGMMEAGNVRDISGLMPDYMGFIFYPGSKRYAGRLSPEEVKDLPDSINKVSVFVNASREEIISTCRAYSIRILQLHGDESQLNHYTLELPFFLSGGVAPGDAERIMDMDMPQLYAVDLNSRFEIKPGLKNIEELENFIRKIKT